MTLKQKQQIEFRLNILYKEARSNLLDCIEILLSEHPEKTPIRSNIFRVFGDRGLPIRTKELLDEVYESNWGEE